MKEDPANGETSKGRHAADFETVHAANLLDDGLVRTRVRKATARCGRSRTRHETDLAPMHRTHLGDQCAPLVPQSGPCIARAGILEIRERGVVAFSHQTP